MHDHINDTLNEIANEFSKKLIDSLQGVCDEDPLLFPELLSRLISTCVINVSKNPQDGLDQVYKRVKQLIKWYMENQHHAN